MLITLERFTLVAAGVMALCTFNFVGRAQIGSPFRQIGKQDLSRFALGTSEEDVPFSGNQTAHEEYPRTVKSADFIAQIDVALNTFLA